jgi:hypothetical protein
MTHGINDSRTGVAVLWIHNEKLVPKSASHDSSSSSEEDAISQDDADFTQNNFLLKIMRGGRGQLPMATTSMILNTNASSSKTHETIMAPAGASGSAVGFKEPIFSSKRCSPRFCRNLVIEGGGTEYRSE